MNEHTEATSGVGSDQEASGGASQGRSASDDGPAGGGSRSQRFGDGIKQGIGVLSAFKDALEETIQEARERGDLSSDRAKEVMKDALDRAQTAADGARERLDFANQAELQALRNAVDDLTERVAALEGTSGGATDAEDAPEA
jgi:polyhydroxyalkanoate synthesis regulator phasin